MLLSVALNRVDLFLWFVIGAVSVIKSCLFMFPQEKQHNTLISRFDSFYFYKLVMIYSF